jgi:hypothetical protein
MSKKGEPKVRFLSLSSLKTSRGGLLFAESALFTLFSLLIVADSGARRGAIAFFLLSTRFATSLTFVFHSFSSASGIKREFSDPRRAFPQTPTRRPPLSSNISSIPRRNQTANTFGTRAKAFSPSKGFRRRFSSKHSTRASELRREARGRCPRRGEEEEALRKLLQAATEA